MVFSVFIRVYIEIVLVLLTWSLFVHHLNFTCKSLVVGNEVLLSFCFSLIQITAKFTVRVAVVKIIVWNISLICAVSSVVTDCSSLSFTALSTNHGWRGGSTVEKSLLIRRGHNHWELGKLRFTSYLVSSAYRVLIVIFLWRSTIGLPNES